MQPPLIEAAPAGPPGAARAADAWRTREARLLQLACEGPEAAGWRAPNAGAAHEAAFAPSFLAGAAVLIANVDAPRRARWLQLAQELCPQSLQPAWYEGWLREGWVRPARFAPMLRARLAAGRNSRSGQDKT